jgi:2-deoxy-D-gluconate 3-dehydrogenase
VARFGRIDILIADAGIAVGRRAVEMPEADWRRTLDINLSGSFFSAQAVHPHMKAAGGGKIVTIGSMMSIFGAAGAPDYGASKGAVVQLTRALAAEWARKIQVNCILPGWIASDMGNRAKSWSSAPPRVAGANRPISRARRCSLPRRHPIS